MNFRATLVQELQRPLDATNNVFHVVAGRLGDAGEWFQRFHSASCSVAAQLGNYRGIGVLPAGDQCDQRLGFRWNVEFLVIELDLPTNVDVKSLSGRLKCRVLPASPWSSSWTFYYTDLKKFSDIKRSPERF